MTTTTGRPLLTALRAAWLFDGVTDTLTADPTVVLDGATIVAAGPSLRPPDGATVIDLPGATLLPGLVDPHVHLGFDASQDVVAHLQAMDDDALLAAMAAAARTAAQGGVTTVRDLGDRRYLSLSLRDTGDPAMPTVLSAGPPITTPGGHCHFLGGEAVGVEGIRAAVREHAERGVDVIKIMASGGNLTPGCVPVHVPQFAVDELRCAVDEAHRLGLPVAAHTHGTQPVIDAVAVGVDTLEHVSFMTEDGVDTPPPELVAEIAARGITASVSMGLKPVPGAEPQHIAVRIPRMMGNLTMLYQAGVRMVAGTDAGIVPTKPHDAARWAVADLVRIGMSPFEALCATTSVAAQVCGLGERKGRIAPGYDADVLAIDGDPFQDPTAVHNIRQVYVRGVAVLSTTQ